MHLHLLQRQKVLLSASPKAAMEELPVPFSERPPLAPGWYAPIATISSKKIRVKFLGITTPITGWSMESPPPSPTLSGSHTPPFSETSIKIVTIFLAKPLR